MLDGKKVDLKEAINDNINSDIDIDQSENKTINNTINIINDPQLIKKNTQLENVIELLFGENYEEFLQNQKKNHTELTKYLVKILDDKNIFETIEILKDEITKREKLQKELEETKEKATSKRLKEIIPLAEKALDEFRYEDYHKILSEFRDSTKDIIKDVAKTYYLEARAYYDRLEYQKALEYMRKAVNFDEENSDYLNKYGQYLHNLAQYSEAIKYFNKALNIDLKNFGDNHPKIAIYNNNLGSAYDSLGEYQKAINYYNKALNIDLNNFGDNHPYTAIDYNNLGSAYDSLGEYQKAIKYYDKALNIDLNNFGDNHPQIAIYNNNLGGAYNSLGEYQKAIDYFNKALNIDLNNFGDKHPQIAIRYNNLGSAYLSKGEYKKAIEYLEKTLKIFRDTFNNENHPSIKNTKIGLQSAKEALKNSKSN